MLREDHAKMVGKNPKKQTNKRLKTPLKTDDHVISLGIFWCRPTENLKHITDLDAALPGFIYTVYFTRGLALFTVHINVHFRHNRINGETLLNSTETGNLIPESTDR